MIYRNNNATNLFLLCILAMVGSTAEAFASAPQRPPPSLATTTTTPSTTSLPMMTGVMSDIISSSHMTLATIDADIANIPTNEFRTVFLGGLAVMAGGLLSAVAVGVILEASDGYAAVVAESYDNLEADEAFWQGLSEEEAKKARDMLAKVRQQKGQPGEEEPTLPASSASRSNMDASPSPSSSTSATETKVKAAVTEKKVDMFSDY
eukprot:scaffold19_cov169-Amphora_coffeaeformis.AAC.10